MSDLVIETKKLTKIYGEQTAVKFCESSCKTGPDLWTFRTQRSLVKPQL